MYASAADRTSVEWCDLRWSCAYEILRYHRGKATPYDRFSTKLRQPLAITRRGSTPALFTHTPSCSILAWRYFTSSLNHCISCVLVRLPASTLSSTSRNCWPLAWRSAYYRETRGEQTPGLLCRAGRDEECVDLLERATSRLEGGGINRINIRVSGFFPGEPFGNKLIPLIHLILIPFAGVGAGKTWPQSKSFTA